MKRKINAVDEPVVQRQERESKKMKAGKRLIRVSVTFFFLSAQREKPRERRLTYRGIAPIGPR
jgi:hypothetical protein